MSTKPISKGCTHSTLLFTPSTHSKSAGYSQPTSSRCLAATTTRGTLKSLSNTNVQTPSPSTFPAPLILPNDELALDPKCSPQSLHSWIGGKHRNEVTPGRRTLYVARPPEIEKCVDFMEGWKKPRRLVNGKSEVAEMDVKDVVEYLEAFYLGMTVEQLPGIKMSFTEWADDKNPGSKSRPKKAKPTELKFIGLNSPCPDGPISTRIRTRPTPKGSFTHQLNLNDLLDAAISSLPEDAYALVVLVDHDLYEDDDDEFVCGTAYGGSRVAVISAARYNPALDEEQGVSRDHAWPASHCREYARGCCEEEVKLAVKPKKGVAKRQEVEKEIIMIDSSSEGDEKSVSAIEAAISAHSSLPSLESSPSAAALAGLLLGRVCRTTAHELGHCFGMDHCSYYACSMQGSASIIEDARQPPYLCPVDLAKVLRATEGDMAKRYEALLLFCEHHKHTHLFAAYGAWIKGRLEELRT